MASPVALAYRGPPGGALRASVVLRRSQRPPRPGVRAQQLPEFLPPEVKDIEDAAARALLSRMRRLPVHTPLSPQPVESSCIVPGVAGQARVPLLLLHGFDSSCLEWRRGFPQLEAQGLEPWAVDILGWGFSGTAEAEVTSFAVEAKRVHLVEGVLPAVRFCMLMKGGSQFMKQHLGSRPAIVVGPSLGGAAALDLAIHHPELVAGLVLVDAQGYAEGVGGMASLPDWVAKAGVALLKSVPLRLYAGSLAYHDSSMATRDAMRVGRLHCQMPGWDAAKLDFMRSGGYNVAAQIPGVQQRTLVVWGANDRILDVSFSKMFMRDLPNASLEVIGECGHLPHLEKPVEFSMLVKEFQASLEATLAEDIVPAP